MKLLSWNAYNTYIYILVSISMLFSNLKGWRRETTLLLIYSILSNVQMYVLTLSISFHNLKLFMFGINTYLDIFLYILFICFKFFLMCGWTYVQVYFVLVCLHYCAHWVLFIHGRILAHNITNFPTNFDLNPIVNFEWEKFITFS